MIQFRRDNKLPPDFFILFKFVFHLPVCHCFCLASFHFAGKNTAKPPLFYFNILLLLLTCDIPKSFGTGISGSAYVIFLDIISLLLPTSVFQLRSSNFGLPSSDFHLRTSDFGLLSSVFQLQTHFYLAPFTFSLAPFSFLLSPYQLPPTLSNETKPKSRQRCLKMLAISKRNGWLVLF
jgi:hypothetical protein